MKRLSSSLPNLILSLGLIAITVGAILAVVYNVTKGPISNVERNKKIAAISSMVPEFDNDPITDTVGVDGCCVHIARKGGEFVGGAVETSTNEGFSGTITLIVGFDTAGTVTGYQVLTHSETPGLGAKMDTWFRDTTANRSVIGRTIGEGELMVAKDGGQVDGITAATITSRAFLQAINRANRAYLQAREEVDR